MNLNFLDYLSISIYFVGLLAFGIIVRRIRNFGDYAVGGRAVPGIMLFASLCATYIGPGYTMGFTSKGFTSGWLFFFAVLAFTLQNILTGLFIAPRLHGFNNCFTVGDVIGNAYGKAAHIIAGVISVTLCAGLVAIMAKVGGLVLQAATGLPLEATVFIVTGVGVIYCYTGGLKSVIATEAIQYVIFAVTIPLFLWFAISKSSVSLADIDRHAWSAMHSTVKDMTFLQIAGLFLSFLLGETLMPPYANRALAAGSPTIARKGFLAGAGYSVLWFAMVVGLGTIAAQTVSTANPDDAFMALAIKFLPHGILGILIVAVASIIMSTQESILNAGAVSFTRDIYNALSHNVISDERRLRLSRFSTLVMGLLGAGLACFAPSIINGLLIIYSVWAPSVLPVFIFAVLLKKPQRNAGASAMLLGALASLIWQFALKEPGQIPALMIGLLVNLATYFAIVIFSKRVA
ncbi:MAG TPA: sodium:solute symporter family protein [Verrucomicrobiae bacterium]|nr:sodium:solute symporter family protein [Verrucomicrobiae bacterium]